MYQLPVNNITRIRRARKQVKKALGDIGLEFCKEAAEDFKEFCPDEQFVKGTLCLDICTWDPSYSKTQEYRSKPFCCTECSFSSKYYSGYKNHFRNVHRHIFDNILLNCPYCAFTANKRTMETHVKIFHQARTSQQNYGNTPQMKYGPSQQPALKQKNKALLDRARQMDGVERPMYYCKKCTFRDSLYNVVRRHIYREHFQHIVAPYLGMVSESSVKNGASAVNGNNILCKRCQFSTRSYEALVQHVVEYHERIGAQVTTMIGHANVMVSRSQAVPLVNPKPPLGAQTLTSQPSPLPVIGYLKPAAPVVKNHSPVAALHACTTVVGNTSLAEKNSTGVNTFRTQKWKICTVCNELFPENLYSAHFETAHKAKKVWAMAKYIMKIHNFTSKCLLCNRYLPSNTLLNHVLIHGLTCPQCHAVFHSVEKLIEHGNQAHASEYVGPPGASPLTFDLTVKEDISTNIQLLVLTFNTKNNVNGQDGSLSVHNSASLPVKMPAPKIIEKKSQHLATSMLSSPLSGKSQVGKTLCPLCFSILKGPVSDALNMHLRERHQVLQTMHPVEKKMTYKCIHCLGVYTSNMVASTITLHLVQCRAVGRNQGGLKSPLTLSASGAGLLKRQLPMQTMSNAKRLHLSKDMKISSTAVGNQAQFGLVLDPTGFEHKTYEARKDFLTAYFNRRPYLSAQEEDKLSSSLWLWKSDIASHFAVKRKVCEKNCTMGKVSVLLGFDMHALKQVKHDLIFEERGIVASSVAMSAESKSCTLITDKKNRGETLNCTFKLSTCTETISIDSDSEPETEGRPSENGNVDAKKHNSIEETKNEADEIQPLAEDSNPVANECEPVEDEIQPMADEIEPVEDEIQSVADEIQPVADEIQPVADEIQPVADEIQPVADECEPAEDEIQPAEDEIQPAEDEIQPAEDEIQPAEDEIQPAEDEIQPAEDEIQPLADEIQPLADEIQPAENDIQPLANEIQPAENDIQPLANEIQPAENDIQPLADEIQPIADEIQPAENDIQPLADEMQPLADECQPVADEIQSVVDACQHMADEIQSVGDDIRFVAENQPVAEGHLVNTEDPPIDECSLNADTWMASC